MKLGDQEITRESMPSFGMTQLNPSHIELAMQDVLARITQQGMGAAAAMAPTPEAPNGAEQAAQATGGAQL